MAAAPDAKLDDVQVVQVPQQTSTVGVEKPSLDEKNPDNFEAISGQDNGSDYDDAAKIYVPDDNEEFIDPRLKDYPVPLVAKTVDLHNDFE